MEDGSTDNYIAVKWPTMSELELQVLLMRFNLIEKKFLKIVAWVCIFPCVIISLTTDHVLLYCILVCFIILCVLDYWWSYSTRTDDGKAHAEKQIWNISNSGVEVFENGESIGRFTLDRFRGMKKMDNYIFIYLEKNAIYIIRKSDYSLSQLKALEEILKLPSV